MHTSLKTFRAAVNRWLMAVGHWEAVNRQMMPPKYTMMNLGTAAALAVLTAAETAFYTGHSWTVASPPAGEGMGFPATWRPVHLLRYVEWVV